MRRVYKIPDFTDDEGCFYSEIEFIVVADSDDIRETTRLACSIQKSLSPRTESPAPSPNRCRRPNGTPRAWFATAAEAVAFAENPANVAAHHWPILEVPGKMQVKIQFGFHCVRI